MAPQIVRLRSTYSAYAYALRASLYDAVIAWHSTPKRQIDTNYRQLKASITAMAFTPISPG